MTLVAGVVAVAIWWSVTARSTRSESVATSDAELALLSDRLSAEDRHVLDQIADPRERVFSARVLSFRQHPTGDPSELAPFVESVGIGSGVAAG